MIITPEDKAKEIVDAIGKDMEIDKPGTGIVFVQDIRQAYGMYEDIQNS